MKSMISNASQPPCKGAGPAAEPGEGVVAVSDIAPACAPCRGEPSGLDFFDLDIILAMIGLAHQDFRMRAATIPRKISILKIMIIETDIFWAVFW
jgi:hypothetical protein